jgi:acyl-CoA synthetase (AMP-forming)/AMP-acid ligase II
VEASTDPPGSDEGGRGNTIVRRGWNFADLWETVAGQIPEALAQQQGARTFTWAEFNRRSNGIASVLLRPDSAEQDKVAQYLYNGPEYLESIFAAFKIGFAAVNTNYRYTADELVYLWDNADVVAVVFHGAFVAQCESVRPKVPRVRTWLWVDDGTGPCPDWATPYGRPPKQAPTTTSWPTGAAAATTCCCSTPAEPPGCPRA